MLIACPTCGRLQFDMDTVVAEIERRLEDYEDPIEVAVLGCAVNGIGEASHADFGITGAKDEGLIFCRGQAAAQGPHRRSSSMCSSRRSTATRRRKKIVVDERAAAEGAAWLAENEDATAMTPERLAALEAAESQAHDGGDDSSPRSTRQNHRRRSPLHAGLSGAGARTSRIGPQRDALGGG